MKKDPKAVALFREIMQKTNEKALSWKPKANAGHYVAALGGKYTLNVWPYTSMDEQGNTMGPPSITLNDEKDRLLVDMSYDIEGIGSQQMELLNATIARAALGVDEKIDDALGILSQLRAGKD